MEAVLTAQVQGSVRAHRCGRRLRSEGAELNAGRMINQQLLEDVNQAALLSGTEAGLPGQGHLELQRHLRNSSWLAGRSHASVEGLLASCQGTFAAAVAAAQAAHVHGHIKHMMQLVPAVPCRSVHACMSRVGSTPTVS